MSATAAFLVVDQGWRDVFPWVARQLSDAGLRVKPTFDLQVARQTQKDCACPHHGTEECNCQMLILLVYRNSGSPITLTIHGYDASTWLSMVDIPGQRADPYFEALIRRLLTRPVTLSSPTESVYESRLSD